MSFFLAVIIGAVTGVISAWGIGGGTLLVLYMSAFTKISQHAAQGINLLYFLPTSAAALVSHIRNKLVDWKCVIPAIIAGVPVAVLTSLLALNLDTKILSKCFSVFVIIVGVSEFFRKPKGQQGGQNEKGAQSPQGNKKPAKG